MNINSIPSTSIASSVWSAAARTLTAQILSALNAERAFISPVTSAVQGTMGTYVQLVASTAHTVRGVLLTVVDATAARTSISVEIATGIAASEVTKIIIKSVGSTGDGMSFYFPLDETLIPKAVRVAVRVSNDSAAVADTVNVNVTLLEAND